MSKIIGVEMETVNKYYQVNIGMCSAQVQSQAYLKKNKLQNFIGDNLIQPSGMLLDSELMNLECKKAKIKP